MVFIKEAISGLLDNNTRGELAETLEVTSAMVSVWLQKDNDFCPRIGVAGRLYKHYGIVVFPYSKEALDYVNEA